MRRFSVVGTLVVLLTLIVGLSWLGVELIGRSFVDGGESEDEVRGLSAEVSITRDSYGIPYIEATTESDAWAALGYAHAQDRLWQMDLLRRAGEGRLSEIFGRRTIGYDVFLRTVGFRRIAQKILKEMPRRTRALLDAYSRGVNAYIDSHHGSYALEFDALGYEPEPWTPLHSTTIMRLFAWELNTSFWSDLVHGDIAAVVDSTRLAEVLPYWPSDAPTIVPGGQRPEPLLEELARPLRPETVRQDSLGVDSTDSLRPVPASPPKPADSTRRSGTIGGIIDLERSLRRELGIDGSHIGSNAWVVSGRRTASGAPMLANDPHLNHAVPCRWYQAVVAWKGERVAGVTLPGVPFVVIGRNERIAWGITSMMADETDFYVETLDSTKRDRVLHDGSWEKLTMLRDTIRVRDSASVPIVVRISRHGPLISDADPYSDRPGSDSASSPMLRRSAIAMRWTGSDASQEASVWQAINVAKDVGAFSDALRPGTVPALSFLYADVGGSIAFIPTGRIPVRGAGNSNLPSPGSDSRYNWKGYHPTSRLPRLTNPESGFIASANNRLSNSLQVTVGDVWEDPSRAERLVELLSLGDNLTPTDFVQMQGDVVSPHMLYMSGFLLRAFPDSARQGSAVRNALARLAVWDGGMREGSPEAAIAAVWLQKVIEATYRDELGPALFDHYAASALLPIRALRYHVMIDSRWFDDVRTKDRIERRDDILRQALGDALEELNRTFGTWKIADWRYGTFHTLTLHHPFQANEQLRDIVNIGPHEVGGSNTTVNNAEWDLTNPYRVRVGPSMRQIVDLGDTSVLLRNVITTGASGQPLNRFYENQTILWLSNGYVSLHRSVPTGGDVTSVTRLHPAGSPDA